MSSAYKARDVSFLPLALTNGATGRRSDVQFREGNDHVAEENRAGDRIDQRHRPRHRERARGARRQHRPERLRRRERDREAPRRDREKPQASRCRYDGADLSKPDANRNDDAPKRSAEFGAIDVLVNNAGIQHVAPIEELPVDKWNAILAINLSASFHAIRLALPAMKARRVGPHHQHRFRARARCEPVQIGVRRGQARHRRTDQDGGARSGRAWASPCNAICPGYVWTPLVQKQIPDTARARGMTEQQVINDVLLARAADQEVRADRRSGRLRRVPRERRRRIDHRRRAADRRRLDGPISGSSAARGKRHGYITQANCRKPQRLGERGATHEAGLASGTGRAGAAGRRRARRVSGGRLRGAARSRHRARLGDRDFDRRDQRRDHRGQSALSSLRTAPCLLGRASSSAPVTACSKSFQDWATYSPI